MISCIYGCIPHGYLESEKDRRGRHSFIDVELPWLYTGLWMLGAKSGSCRATSDLNCKAISPAWDRFAWSQILSPEESSHSPLRIDYTCSKFTLGFEIILIFCYHHIVVTTWENSKWEFILRIHFSQMKSNNWLSKIIINCVLEIRMS